MFLVLIDKIFFIFQYYYLLTRALPASYVYDASVSYERPTSYVCNCSFYVHVNTLRKSILHKYVEKGKNKGWSAAVGFTRWIVVANVLKIH